MNMVIAESKKGEPMPCLFFKDGFVMCVTPDFFKNLDEVTAMRIKKQLDPSRHQIQGKKPASESPKKPDK